MITLEQSIQECLNNKEFVKEYNRLNNTKLLCRSPIEIMIDKSTGYDKKLMYDFCDFVKTYVRLPLATS